ncbi:GlxA family transcriptional regulator [uncultured Roseobacter sp.]|uniref:GlxA family transcriptional regulator n=1 Tax=uncultured Roseobacter sp. TaxID=114847 RepID=UPI002614E913|nr:helix-turn-helix domain-containing protein [uncultured Roseobacter sp.]
MTAGRTIDIQLLALEESSAAALYGMLEVLSTAGRPIRESRGMDPAPATLVPRIVSPLRKPFQCAHGIPVVPHCAMDADNIPGVLIITEFWLTPGDDMTDRYDDVKDWLRLCREAGTTIYSVCVGSVLVAAAGLLDGRPATSHWAFEGLFRQSFPRVKFDPRPSICFSDPSGRLVTAAGASSWHDLALYTIAHHVSPEEAMLTAKFFLLNLHPDGQLPYANRIVRRPHADNVVRRAETWLAENFRDPDPVAGVVDAVGIPERSLKRRFSQATGQTLISYAQDLRVEAAKRALESGQASVEDIAADVGYENVAFFRRLFKRTSGLGPTAYRRLYRPLEAHTALTRQQVQT